MVYVSMETKPGVSYIHIDSKAVLALTAGQRVPIVAVWKDGVLRTGYRLRIEGPSEVVYAAHFTPDKMLMGKYHTWIETTAEVVILE